MPSTQEMIFFQNTALSYHDSFPDTDVFMTKIYGLWTTPTNRHFLGAKITPDLFQHIAYFYREPNDTFSVEVWSRPNEISADDLIGCPQMSWDEYAWVVGCSVDELSPAPTTQEEDSVCIDIELLKQEQEPKPEAHSSQSDSNVVIDAEGGIGSDETQRRLTRREKGKERETQSIPLKRENSATSDDGPGPSKRPCRSTSSEPVRPVAGPSAGPSRYVTRRRRDDVGYKRGEFDCDMCGLACATKQVQERHILTHVDDPIVFVCGGKQGTDGKFTGRRCLKSYVRVDSFKRHIFRADGSRRRKCHRECTPMLKSDYIALCKERGIDPKAK